MKEFHYAKISFCLDSTDPKAESFPVGLIAEWYDGEFWKFALVAAQELRFEEFEKLDNFSKSFLSDPFSLLYHTIDHYIKDHGWTQSEHDLGHFLRRVFGPQTNLHAEFLFEAPVGNDEDPEETFEELCLCIPGNKLRKAYWHRLSSQDLTSVDGTKLLD